MCFAEDCFLPVVYLEIYGSLAGSVESFNKCYEGRYQFLCARRAEILKAYGLESEGNVLSKIGDANCAELGNLLNAMVELRGDSDKLQWYYRVNAEAIDLIYAKIERHCVHPMVKTHRSRKSRWMDMTADWEARSTQFGERLSMLTAGIARSCANAKLHPAKGSSCLDCVGGRRTWLDDYRASLVSFIREDNKSWELAPMLEKMSVDDAIMGLHFRALVYDLALLAIVSGARDSAAFLLEKAFTRYGAAVDHNVLNQIIAVVGRRGVLNGQSSLKLLTCSLGDDTGGQDGMGESLFLRAVERLGPDGEDILLSTDILGRRPLHYGAMYGLQTVCQRILRYFEERGLLRLARQILTVDSQGQTPLHYAVINNHAGVTRIFLDVLDGVEDSETQNQTAISNEVFSIAVKYQHDEIVYMLAKCRAVSHPSHGETETALYIAAQSGRADYVEALLNHNKDIDLNINTPEPIHGWTPLFIACVEGHHAVVRLLLRAGAKQDIRDQLGWTAKEHAALRGHLEIADMVDAGNTDDLDISGGPSSVLPKTAPTEKAIFRKNRSYVIVNLGALQYGQRGEALELRDSSHSLPMPKSVYAHNGLSMEISIGDGRDTNSHRVQLPLLRDMLNEPFVFPVVDPTEAVISFKLFRAGHRLVGSGAALLKSLNDGLGEGRESLVRTRTIAILEREKLGVMGTVTFTFVVAGPVDCAVSRSLQSRDVRGGGVQLVGHRGGIEPPLVFGGAGY